MDGLDLKQELTRLLEREVGFTGRFILKKQCKHLNIDPDRIGAGDLAPLADRIAWAIKNYTGEKKANAIRNGILKYRKALETVTEPEVKEESVAHRVEAQLTIADGKLAIGMTADAEAVLREAKTLLEESDPEANQELRIKVARHLARVLGRSKEKAGEAVAEYEAAISVGERIGHHYDVALSWNGLGAMAWRAGEHKRALKCYTKALNALRSMQALSKREKVKKRKAEALIKSGLGNVYLDLLDMDAAIRNNEEAVEMSKEAENWSEVGRIYNNLARVYEEMGDFARAIDRYERGIRHSKAAGELRMEGWTLTNLASALIETGRASKALRHLERAEKILADFRDPIAHSKLHCMWGKYYREEGVWDAAIEHFQRGIEFVKNENAPDYLAIVEEEFGMLYQRMGEKEKAVELLGNALAWYEKKEEANRIKKIKTQLEETGD